MQAWQALTTDPGGARVDWEDRRWPSIGAQRVPVRLVLTGADAIAAFAGTATGHDWALLRGRADVLRGVFGPQTASADALAAVSGRDSLGLLEAPTLIRVRFLDPRLRPGGLDDLSAPLEQLAALPMAPTTVFVFENLETVLAMPDLPGAVVVHGSGYAAPRLRAIPWIASSSIRYWGDLDSDGFAILYALRVSGVDVTSVLMDEATLLAFRDLWVPEPTPAGGSYSTLTAGETAALDRIRSEGNVRLEQERIPWSVALDALTATLPVARYPAGHA